MSKRKYTKRRRAEQEADTRRRIVTATAELHGERGPRNTSVSAIAERAGVQRLTVYRHFPDDHALFRACTAHWLQANPPPDPADWSRVSGAVQITRTALVALYAYFRRTSRMWRLVYRDRDEVPAVQGPLLEFEQYLDGIREDLIAAWAPKRRDARALRVVLGHTLKYSSWQSFDAEGLSDNEIADLAMTWLNSIKDGTPGRAAPDEGAGAG